MIRQQHPLLHSKSKSIKTKSIPHTLPLPLKMSPLSILIKSQVKEFPFFSIIFPFILLAIFGKLPAKFWALYLGSPYTNMSYGFFSQVFMLCSHIYRNTSGTHPPTTLTSIDLATLFHCQHHLANGHISKSNFCLINVYVEHTLLQNSCKNVANA